MRQKKVLESILQELKNIHYHAERVEVFTMMAHNIKENDKGAWIEDNKGDKETIERQLKLHGGFEKSQEN